MSLPTPQEINDAARAQGDDPPFSHYPDRRSFENAGGSTKAVSKGDRWLVSVPPMTYGSAGVDTALDALEAAADLLNEHWTIFVWDFQENEGWSFEYWTTQTDPDGDLVWPEELHRVFPSAFRRRRSLSSAAPASGTATAFPGVAQADIDLVDRHRKQLGMAPLDPRTGWSAREVQEMADSIRTKGRLPNPRYSLKRKLMQ